ncbi:MAG TPA: DegT/DnrJ/EryC1/StrS family aminotransferase [Candidatus Polarisedimenticolia bacterium]|nr:DegT/DnrJ/EryC1/StrS family aminotransferase [Candidatus Polarisedimenticolia bacterium]
MRTGAARPLAAEPGPGAARPALVVPHTRPFLGVDEEEAALRVIRSARLAPGAEAARLEGLLSRLAGSADAVALNSGTTALTLALRALGVPEGAGVVVPSWTCAALLHAVAGAGARPIVCDVDPDTLALDPDRLRRGPAAAARAVIVVHPFGLPVPVEPYRADGRVVIEDCAQSPGARLQGRPVGAAGAASVFSFGPTKLLTCGGPGGGLASGDPSIVRTARDLAGHDEKEDARPRLNGLMGDLHAAVASAQIGRLGVVVTRRRAIVERYDAAFQGIGSRPRLHPTAQPVFYRYLLGLPARAGQVIDRLRKAGIQARFPVHRPLHRLVAGSGPCPGADEAQGRWISLPLAAAFSSAEVDRVIDEVTACLSSRS